MSTRNNDEDTAYNHEVLREVRASAQDRNDTRDTIRAIRDSMFRAIGLLHADVVALQKTVAWVRWLLVILSVVLIAVVIAIIAIVLGKK